MTQCKYLDLLLACEKNYVGKLLQIYYELNMQRANGYLLTQTPSFWTKKKIQIKYICKDIMTGIILTYYKCVFCELFSNIRGT